MKGKDKIRRIFYACMVGLPLFCLLGLVVIETPGVLRSGDLSYQWLWFSRLGLLFSVCASLGGIFAMCGRWRYLPGLYKMVIGALIVWGGVEAIWGLCQIYGLASSNHSLYGLTGSFFNPGPYSGYLAMIFPLCLNEWLEFKRKKERSYIGYAGYYLSGGVMLLIVCLLPAGMSRSAWMAAVVSGAWVCSVHYGWKGKWRIVWQKHRARVIGVAVLVCICLMIGGVALFHLKKDSASGRLLMWKISCYAIKEKPMGYGDGKFAYAYGNAQEAYFAKGDYSLQEELVAGSPEYAFNEYLQVAVEWGVAGLAVVLTCIGLCLWQGIRKRRIGICGGIIALLVFAFSSYPMQIPAFVVSLLFLLAVCVVGRSPQKLLIFALCIGGISYNVYQNNVYPACKNWSGVRMLYKVGGYESAKEGYANLYPSLKKRAAFLFEYGHTLHKLKEYDASTKILEEAELRSCDPMILNIIGKNYQGMKEYEKAEAYLIRSTHRLPGRIYPYYLLAKLYEEWGKKEKMVETARIVLTKEPKIQSTAVKEMRTEIKKLIKKQV